MILRLSVGLLMIGWLSGDVQSSNVRFPTDQELDQGIGHTAEDRYSDQQAAAVVMQPNGIKRLPHYIVPQAPGGQNPFGHVNPGGYSEGVLLSHPSGRPPPSRQHYKPNTKLPDKMKPVQRIPLHRVVAKPHPSQIQQTRKPLFAPKPQQGKETRQHPEIIKQKQKYHHGNKEYHQLPKPDGLGGLTEKEIALIKSNKYFLKGSNPYTEGTRPYKFIPTPPPQETSQNYEKNHKEKYGYSGLSHYGSYKPHTEYPQYHQHEEVNKKTYNKHFVPVQEQTDDIAYQPKKEFTNYKKQSTHYGHNKKQEPTVESIVDYINKWTASSASNNNYDKKYNTFAGDLDDGSFDKTWLAGSEWVPIHAPAPAQLPEKREYNFDDNYSSSTFASNYAEPPQFNNNYSESPQYDNYSSSQYQSYSQTYSNNLAPQSSTNNYPRLQTESGLNSFDIGHRIFNKPEVVMGKRPKSADFGQVNNSHEVSAVFMVKQ